MNKKYSLIFLSAGLTATLLVACPAEKSENEEPKTSQPQAEPFYQNNEVKLQKGREISGRLLKELKGVLTETLKKKGAKAAFKTCHMSAAPLTQGIANDQKLRLKRVSFKVRNPENAPDKYESELLHQLEKMNNKRSLTPQNEVFQVIETEGKKEFLYLRPIFVQKGCLQCHGQSKEIKVLDEIKTLYPNDQATAYQEGDLRGAVSVRWDL